MNLSKNSIIMIVAAAIVLGGLAYYFLFFTSDSGSAVEAGALGTSAAELTFIDLAGQLDPIQYDLSLLSDPRFMARTDIRTTIVPEAAGRHDPFGSITGQ